MTSLADVTHFLMLSTNGAVAGSFVATVDRQLMNAGCTLLTIASA